MAPFSGGMGGAVPIHYDLALVNDLQNSGAFSQGDLSWAEIFNARWSPSNLPLFLGVSQTYQRLINSPQPSAYSLYAAVSGDRLTNGKLTATVLGEMVVAKNWNNPNLNNSLGSFFTTGGLSSYQAAVASARSRGFYLKATYDISPKWNLFYKYDDLLMDTDFSGDGFARHGFGSEVFLNSNLILNFRYEKAVTGLSEASSVNELATQNDFMVMLRVWL